MFGRALKFAPLIQRTVTRSTQTKLFSSIRFAASHEYVKMDGDIGTVGISKHACDALGDVVFVELPNVGDSFEAGESFGAVESVKAASDVYMPIKGEIVEVNNALEGSPEQVNESPVESGWFVRIKVDETGKSQYQELMDEVAYEKHTEDD
mmetsp:Transcript_13577/g.20377  ORF Transcript_13577/g.20377 Transcript_13577/m.20377 type:complete len:151 (+) Transcript_13577:100-552(+)|eukprot:CAMPEP_0185023586 /NCGR_PEP_ID=MMETSP1103-20130426/6244_1 /TAXON_ID=36769 /ORGANISM="Paraphysomonas bandaiensis, Strain Caron Lab Isolate" /LENGTH=150 /DNA_ID=CAMNT_0027556249 /DNA_START=78 /DNA_END=530 /DNA_ORIENTATION=+